MHSCISWNDTAPEPSTHPVLLWTGLDHVTGVIRLPCCSAYVHVASGLVLRWDVKCLAGAAAHVSPGQNARLPLCPWVVSIPVCTVRWWSVCLQWPAWGPSHLPNVAFTPPPVYLCVCERKSVSLLLWVYVFASPPHKPWSSHPHSHKYTLLNVQAVIPRALSAATLI